MLDNDSQQGTSEDDTGPSSAKDLSSELVPTSRLSPEQSLEGGDASPPGSDGHQSETLTVIVTAKSEKNGTEAAEKLKAPTTKNLISLVAVVTETERN
ncbi:hypothetical protein AgCh_019948 [Apium graveolens]